MDTFLLAAIEEAQKGLASGCRVLRQARAYPV